MKTLLLITLSLLSLTSCNMQSDYSPLDSYTKAVDKRFNDSIAARNKAISFIDIVNHIH